MLTEDKTFTWEYLLKYRGHFFITQLGLVLPSMVCHKVNCTHTLLSISLLVLIVPAYIFFCHINTFPYDLTLFSADILQVECHPYLNQRKLLDFCKSHDIVLVAYAALGSQRLKEWY